ncbi:MAG: GNAT family N-acetyltransferase [Pseudomonadota bacterium]
MSTYFTIWYLEMTAAAQHFAKPMSPELQVVEARLAQYAVNRFLYEWIGASWQWEDKKGWSDQQWQAYVERDTLRTWLAWVEGSPAGYFELERAPDGTVEICYFGLSPDFIGKGLGGGLLSAAIREAWGWDARRVAVNTCSLDHPAALKNYQARGFRLTYTETRTP